MKSKVRLLCASIAIVGSNAFSGALFQQAPTKQRTAPSKKEGVDIELPDFDELFNRISQVSPLARRVIESHNAISNNHKAFHADDLKWSTIESNPRRLVNQIEKIDNFDGKGAPILRFRSSMEGPCVGEYFADFIMTLERRALWDPQIEEVFEIYPIHDLDAANIAMSFGRYGDCARLGIGYCRTKANVVSAREQLTLCGIQDFADGSCIIWGTEMEDWHDHMLPPRKRVTRARSHIFSTTLTPTGDNTFDVEYVLQLNIGGKIPSWMTAPIVTDTVKSLFKTADQYFRGKDGHLEEFMKQKQAESDSLIKRHSLLMTP